ncbi:MAG: DEAD/DEAH box helicase [Hallerella porci]|uniref:RNA helicase n=1 Tax=Hallerella porci TaxID=1945871 RepID=A0ABX5LMB4_9BACT|nr:MULTISPECIES: DEAD/DEAH box helicase [Hallerella]MCI5599751.1 DEAD/DEAH box helicase [Hallerella sp.]MDY3922452.1 DEAD/DEAH box helicase [Hallerella porci]PWK94504.1 ATP-dependent RNA helicase DeaD [Hallerella porci]
MNYTNDSENSLGNNPNSTEIPPENTDSLADTLKFDDLGLSPEVLEGVQKAGFETPSPIQAKAIPIFLSGKNLLGTAQTGTGKTAAFTLPLLSRIAFKKNETSMLVLSPTRELAIQVAEAIQHFAIAMPHLHIVPVYGGQDIGIQFRALKRTPQIVVATPGRLIDHLKRGTISLEKVQTVVLDEADEMLDMGFMEEVEEILSKVPENAQRGLFSATMPANVKKIIDRYLGDYEEACIEAKTATVDKVRQRYLTVRAEQKMEALTRVLEGEIYDGVIIFVRTKQLTAEVAERLEARGFNAAPLSGDLAQALRERTINRLKEGKIDIIVATDVAARGLDVDRISHVINYDIPYDTESYVHRIGRTARAGREGNAILFITPRERRLLKMIERATRKSIDPMEIPTGEQISERRVSAFKQKVLDAIEAGGLEEFRNLVESLVEEKGIPALDVAAAVTKLAQAGQPLFPADLPELKAVTLREERRKAREDKFGNGPREEREHSPRIENENGIEEGFERYYLGVGRRDHISPRDIVGAIAGESGMDSAEIGRIKLFDRFSTVELPEGLAPEIKLILEEMTIRGNPSRFRLMTDDKPFPKERESFKRNRDSVNRKERRHGKKDFHERPFRERDDKPFRKTRRFGRK